MFTTPTDLGLSRGLFFFVVAIGRGELRSPAGRRGRRPLRGVVSSFKIILVFVGEVFCLPFALIKLHLIRQPSRCHSTFCLAKLGCRLRHCSPAGEGFFLSLAALFSRWRRLFSVACDNVLPLKKAFFPSLAALFSRSERQGVRFYWYLR